MRPLEFREDKGALAETFFFSEFIKKKGPLDDIRFWRTKQKHEVDFIVRRDRKPVAFEIKYQKFRDAQISASMRAFIEAFQLQRSFVITRDYLNKITFKGRTDVYFIPLWMI